MNFRFLKHKFATTSKLLLDDEYAINDQHIYVDHNNEPFTGIGYSNGKSYDFYAFYFNGDYILRFNAKPTDKDIHNVMKEIVFK